MINPRSDHRPFNADQTPDNPSKEHGLTEIIYQLSKILTKDTPEKTQRIVVRVFAVTFPDYHFEFMPNDYHTFKYIRLSWQIGDNQPCYVTYEVTGQDNDEIAKAAYQILLDKAQELNKEDDDNEYPIPQRRRRRAFRD